MKKLSVLAVTIVTAVSISATSCDSKPSAKLNKGIDSASYAIGLANGSMFKQNLSTFPGNDPINVDALLAGFIQAMKGDSSAMQMSPEEAQTFIQTFVTRIQEEETAAQKEEGDKFLAENKTKPGVITTASGLQYQVVTEGTGARPVDTDQVKVYYTGTLLDGTEFDSTAKNGGEPAVFGVTQVIPGWTEGLKIMPVGSKYIFWIPSDLAYGVRGAGQQIKPNSTLKFEVELLEIVK